MSTSVKYQAPNVVRENRADGTVLLSSGHALGPVVETTGDWLHQWSEKTPDAIFLAERSGAAWREETYSASLEKVRAIASSLLARGLNDKTPIIIMSGNGIDHGLLSLAAQYVGIPVVPVAEQYSLIHGAHGRLRQVIELVRPKMAYVIDAAQFGEALKLDVLDGVEIVASRAANKDMTTFADLLKGDAGIDVDAAHAAIGPDTIAKILMTSGSTSEPKGVLTTHKMLCVNQTQSVDSLPFLREHPPRIVDWLPWNHVFGGSHNFNMALANGGSLYIDDGKPIKGFFERTLENLSMVTGTLAFNVPVGYSLLHTELQKNKELRQRFFGELDMALYAGATLPQDVWQGFCEMSLEVKGEIPFITSSWGLTETAPSVLMQQVPTEGSGIVGVPMNGIVAKLLPVEDGRWEIRVKGPNIMKGYFENPEKTQESFDDEGFFITGDAMKFVDVDDPNKGMRFDGRISEDFKLLTGTWVRASTLRLDVMACLAPIAGDIVITGQDRGEIGLLIFPNRDALQEAGFELDDDGEVMTCELLLSDIRRRLVEFGGRMSGSSTRVARAIVLSKPPSIADSEITAKGNLNFRKILTGRAGLLERLYDDGDPAIIRISSEK